MQQATGEWVELAYVDRGYAGKEPAQEAEARGIRLEVVKKHPASKKGFVLLPRRWVGVGALFGVGRALSALGEGLRAAA